MVLDTGVKTHPSVVASLVRTIRRALAPDPRSRRSTGTVLSPAFVRRRTQFDSVKAFCAACPCDGDTVGAVQRLSADERDAFVARTTDFETWTAMKQSGAVTDLLERAV
ncbi:hypothetical protein [Halococcoides cellulosivorans]|uniref:Uncharacterized protein n=1 Tax=Halococcoides cellulosivorans TaxID=1679096 RepID=A0A2R4X305_9EURY|nr:hypothetical protein [Halococcoides cellulosivorans]AWB28189.1 hypothetical protein HARCEL1_10975 [Halococcoides cellulosivorans]